MQGTPCLSLILVYSHSNLQSTHLGVRYRGYRVAVWLGSNTPVKTTPGCSSKKGRTYILTDSLPCRDALGPDPRRTWGSPKRTPIIGSCRNSGFSFRLSISTSEPGYICVTSGYKYLT